MWGHRTGGIRILDARHRGNIANFETEDQSQIGSLKKTLVEHKPASSSQTGRMLTQDHHSFE